MGNVTKYSEMQELSKEELYEDACKLLGGMNYTLELLDYLGSCTYDLEDGIEDGESFALEGERDFDDYVNAAEDFFEDLDKLNGNYSEWRERVLDGIDAEYGKIQQLIAYRDDVVVEKVKAVEHLVSVEDYDRLWGWISDSSEELNQFTLDREYDDVMNYMDKVDNGLRMFNTFGAMRDTYKEDLFTSVSIDRCDKTFYSAYEHLNPLLSYTHTVRKISYTMNDVQHLLESKYGIDIDAIEWNS